MDCRLGDDVLRAHANGCPLPQWSLGGLVQATTSRARAGDDGLRAGHDGLRAGDDG